MKILNVFEKTIPIHSTLKNARIDFSEMSATVVAVVTDQFRDGRQVIGYAFNSFGRYACGGPLRERFIPRLLNAPPVTLIAPEDGLIDPVRVVAMLNGREKAGAHSERSMAIGTLELALWDVVGKLRQLPLYQVIASRFCQDIKPEFERIPCYAGGGFYKDADELAQLDREIQGYLDSGYTAVKIKVGGLPLEADVKRIEAVLAKVRDGGRLALDASCAFDRAGAVAFGKAIEPYGLRWFEEPCDPLDFGTYHALSESYEGMVAGGENVFSVEEAQNFLSYGQFNGRIVFQPDPPLAYGVGEFSRMLECALSHRVPRQQVIPHGGNLMSLHVAAGFALGSAESYPGLFGQFGGFGDEVTIEDGHASLPSSPGIGFETQPNLYRTLKALVK